MDGADAELEAGMAAFGGAGEMLLRGGVALWVIAAVSVLMVAIILWKLWRLSAAGTWRRARADRAMAAWLRHDGDTARQIARAGHGARARLIATAIEAAATEGLAEDLAREETGRIAKGLISEARSGLRALELIATIAPLLGLLGTVLGMISAFQELQSSGSRADPSALAGGIWEALLTTAAGMAVAIPAAMALAWFESQVDRLRRDLEDIATRIFTRPPERAGVLETRRAAE